MSFDSDDNRVGAYFDLLRRRPEWFANHPRGGIEILTDVKVNEIVKMGSGLEVRFEHGGESKSQSANTQGRGHRVGESDATIGE